MPSTQLQLSNAQELQHHNTQSERLVASLKLLSLQTAKGKEIVTQTCKRWAFNYRSRRQLATLAPGLLDDIGLSHSDALEEVAKPFWRS